MTSSHDEYKIDFCKLTGEICEFSSCDNCDINREIQYDEELMSLDREGEEELKL